MSSVWEKVSRAGIKRVYACHGYPLTYALKDGSKKTVMAVKQGPYIDAKKHRRPLKSGVLQLCVIDMPPETEEILEVFYCGEKFRLGQVDLLESGEWQLSVDRLVQPKSTELSYEIKSF